MFLIQLGIDCKDQEAKHIYGSITIANAESERIEDEMEQSGLALKIHISELPSKLAVAVRAVENARHRNVEFFGNVMRK
jgi:hypothetical protein